MKKSIAHLPKQKQSDLYYLVQKVLEKLPETTMIILYGSYARGNYHSVGSPNYISVTTNLNTFFKGAARSSSN